MISRKEYMYWQNRKDRVSEYICVRASGASKRFFGVFNSFTVKKVNFYTINVKFKVILSSKSGGIFLQTIPPTQKVGGGGGDTSPPPPPDLRQCTLQSFPRGFCTTPVPPASRGHCLTLWWIHLKHLKVLEL